MNVDLSFKKYPYFLSPQLEALENASDEEVRKKVVRRVAALLGDEEALRRLLGIVPEEFTFFYHDRLAPGLSTDDTIASFLERFGSPASAKAEAPADSAGVVPVMPAADYTAMLDRLEQEADAPMPNDETSDAIESFLQAMPPKTGRPDAPARGSAPSERVAVASGGVESAPKANRLNPSENVREFVQRGDYRGALDLLTRLQLSSPEAVPCAEDQIRFLRKLIANASRKA